MTSTEIYDKVRDLADKAAPLGSTLKLDLGDQKIFLDGTGEKNTVSQEDAEADCVLTASPENFSKLLTGDLNPMGAVFSGKLKIKGDMGVAMKVQSLFS